MLDLDEKLVFGSIFFITFISPIIGLIITLVSKNKDDEVYKKEVLETQKSQEEALNKIIKSKESESSKKSVADELEKLKKLKEENSITGEEYEKLKNKLINQNKMKKLTYLFLAL